MNDPVFINRVEAELNQWKSREERFKKIFSFENPDSKALLKEKLYHFERIAAKYKSSENLEEQFAIRIIKLENDRTLKQLYPNLFLRLVRKIISLPLAQRIEIQQIREKTDKNFQSLQLQLQRIGFLDLSTQVRKQLEYNSDKFEIPLSCYMNEKEKVDYQIRFSKSPDGNYKLDGFHAALRDEAKPEERKQHFFKIEDSYLIDSSQAYNLLSGRSVENKERWIKLDLNDKDSNENYRMKEFRPEYGFKLDKALGQLPLKELKDGIEEDNLKNNLRKGERQFVTLLKNGNEQRYYIEANPQFKTLNIFDEHSRKVTISTALGIKTVESTNISSSIVKDQNKDRSNSKGVQISQ